MKKLILAVAMAAGLAGAAAAQAPVQDGAASFCDPAFQDFVETTYGYLNPRTGLAARFRDSVAAPAPAAVAKAAPARGYVSVSILPRGGDYTALLRELSASAGFVLRGERVSRVKGVRRTSLVGWVPVESLAALRANAGVARVAVGKKKAAAL